MYQSNHTLPIIAETAFNHEGDSEYLYSLIKSAAESGASHIKFQVLIDCDEFVSELSDAYSLVKSWVFKSSQWEEIFDYAESLGLRIFVMPLDLASIELCKRDSVDYVEVHSVSFYDRALIDSIKRELRNKCIAFGIGGRTLEELSSLAEDFKDYELMFMCGYQAYPSELESVKIARIAYLKNKFPEVILGYADHSGPETLDALYSSIYAYHLGARVFEKHLTLEHPRTDSQSAYQPKQLKKFVSELSRFYEIINESENDAFAMTDNEVIYRNRQKKVVAITKIVPGEKFSLDNLGLKMHTDDGKFNRLEDILGKVSKFKYSAGDTINE